MDLGSRRDTRRIFVWLGVVALAIGGTVLVYRGPGRPFVRGHVGDVAATMLVFAIVSLVKPRATPGVRALVTMIIATAIEVTQLWFHARSTAGHLVLGSTFDPIDLCAYVVGVGIAIAFTSRWTPARAGNEPRGSAPAGSRFGERSAPVARGSSIERSIDSSGARSRSST